MGNAKSSVILTYDDAMGRLGPEVASRYESAWRRLAKHAGRQESSGLSVHTFTRHVIENVMPDMPPQLANRLFLALTQGSLENASSHDRNLSLEDWITALTVVQHGTSRERAYLLFRVYDTEGTERITHADAVRYMHLVLVDRPSANAAALYSRAVDELFNAAWALASSSGAGQGTGQGTGKKRRIMPSDHESVRAGASLTPLEFVTWAVHQAQPAGAAASQANARAGDPRQPQQGTAASGAAAGAGGPYGRALPSSAWARHPLLGWLDHLALALSPDPQEEALLKRWHGHGHGHRAGPQAVLGPAGRAGPSSLLSQAELSSLSRAFSHAKSRTPSGLFDTTALQLCLLPMVPRASGMAGRLFAGADTEAHGSLGLQAFAAWAGTVLCGSPQDHAALLVRSYCGRPGAGQVSMHDLTALVEGLHIAGRLARGARPVPLGEEAAGSSPASSSAEGALTHHDPSPVLVDTAAGATNDKGVVRVVAEARRLAPGLAAEALRAMSVPSPTASDGRAPRPDKDASVPLEAVVAWLITRPELAGLVSLVRQALRVDCGVRPVHTEAGAESTVKPAVPSTTLPSPEAQVIAATWRGYRRSACRVGEAWYVMPAQWWRAYCRREGVQEAVELARREQAGTGQSTGPDASLTGQPSGTTTPANGSPPSSPTRGTAGLVRQGSDLSSGAGQVDAASHGGQADGPAAAAADSIHTGTAAVRPEAGEAVTSARRRTSSAGSLSNTATLGPIPTYTVLTDHASSMVSRPAAVAGQASAAASTGQEGMPAPCYYPPVLRPSLKRGYDQDYVLVPSRAWLALSQWYGVTGPPVPRRCVAGDRGGQGAGSVGRAGAGDVETTAAVSTTAAPELELHPLTVRVSRLHMSGGQAHGQGQGGADSAGAPASSPTSAKSGEGAGTALPARHPVLHPVMPPAPPGLGSGAGQWSPPSTQGPVSLPSTTLAAFTSGSPPVSGPGPGQVRASTAAAPRPGSPGGLSDMFCFSRWDGLSHVRDELAHALSIRHDRVRLWRRVPDVVLQRMAAMAAAADRKPLTPGSATAASAPSGASAAAARIRAGASGQPVPAAATVGGVLDLMSLVQVWPYLPLFKADGSSGSGGPSPVLDMTIGSALGPSTPAYPPSHLLVDIRGAGPEGAWASETLGYSSAHAALVLAAQAGRLDPAIGALWLPAQARPRRRSSGNLSTGQATGPGQAARAVQLVEDRDSVTGDDVPDGASVASTATVGVIASSTVGLAGPGAGGRAALGQSGTSPLPGGPGPLPYLGYTLLPLYAPVGLGIANLGNTCYLSSPLQALLSLPLFPQYFLSRAWEVDLNTQARLGTGGRLAAALATTVLEAWNLRARGDGRPAVLAPRRLKAWLARTAPRFEGLDQHDAADALSTLLAACNEDLNRVPGPNKPYIEVRDSNGRPDLECAEEWWTGQVLGRDRSIITQLFTGQFKSTLTCEACGHTSARYEPFTMLSLPLPEPPARAITVVVHMPRRAGGRTGAVVAGSPSAGAGSWRQDGPSSYSSRPLVLTVSLPPKGTVWDVKVALAAVLREHQQAHARGYSGEAGRDSTGGTTSSPPASSTTARLPPATEYSPWLLASSPITPDQLLLGRVSGQELVEDVPAPGLAQQQGLSAYGHTGGGSGYSVSGGAPVPGRPVWSEPCAFLPDSLPIAVIRDGIAPALVAWRVPALREYRDEWAAGHGEGSMQQTADGALTTQDHDSLVATDQAQPQPHLTVGSPVWALWKGKPGRAYAAVVVGTGGAGAGAGHAGQPDAAAGTVLTDDGSQPSSYTIAYCDGEVDDIGPGGQASPVHVVAPDQVAPRVPLPARIVLHHCTFAMAGSGTTPVGLQLGQAALESGPATGAGAWTAGLSGLEQDGPEPPNPVGAGSLGAVGYGSTVAYPPSIAHGSTDYFNTPLVRVAFGAPLLLSVTPEAVTGVGLYWRVWADSARFIRRRAPYPSLADAVAGETAALSQGHTDALSIMARWGFVLRRASPHGGCSSCSWLSHCPGCVLPPHPTMSLSHNRLSGTSAPVPVPGNGEVLIDPLRAGMRLPHGLPDLAKGGSGAGDETGQGPPPYQYCDPTPLPRLAIEWDPLVLESSFDRSEAGAVDWHPSVASARAEADRPVSLEACLELFAREERLDEPGYCPACSKVQIPVLKKVRKGQGGAMADGTAGASTPVTPSLLVQPQPMPRSLQSPTLPTTTLASFTLSEGSSAVGDGQGQAQGMAGVHARQPTTAAAAVASDDEFELVQTGVEEDVQLRAQRKRIEPYRVPPVLLLQLKRFQHTAYVRRKLQALVHFPVDIPLCMKPHLARSRPAPCPVDLSIWRALGGRLAEGEGQGQDSAGGQDSHQTPGPGPAPLGDRGRTLSAGPLELSTSRALGLPLLLSRASCCYELWAVVQHHGIMGGGHYTAVVKAARPGGGAQHEPPAPAPAPGPDLSWEWRMANDKSVSPVEPDEVCSPAAYLLFYVRRDISAGWRAGLTVGAQAAGSVEAATRAHVSTAEHGARPLSQQEAAQVLQSDGLGPCPCTGCAPARLSAHAAEPLTTEDVWPLGANASAGGTAASGKEHGSVPPAELLKLLEEVRAAGSLNMATGALTTVLAAVPGVTQERAASIAHAAAGGVAAAADKCAVM